MRDRFPLNQYSLTDIHLVSGRYVDQAPPEGWEKLTKKLPLALSTVKEKGKFIYFLLEQDTSIWSTLGMSGGWTLRENHPNTRVRMTLESTNKGEARKEPIYLHYVDSRNFGTLKVCFDSAELHRRLDKLGPSWLHNKVDLETFRALLKKKGKPQRNRNLCVFLLDQTKTSGIGNYILAEALYAARIDPWTTVGELRDQDIDTLHDAICEIIWSSCRSQVEISSRRFSGLRHGGGGSGLQSKNAFSTPNQRRSCGGHFALKVYGKSTCPEGFQVVRMTNGPHKRPIHFVPDLQTRGE
jgi:formamidopyrimidine-DNA glycosylase